MKNKIYILSDKDLKSFDAIAHSKKIYSTLKKTNRDYADFGKFIHDYSIHINQKLLKTNDLPSLFEDIIFESIISRLDYLNNYKKLSLKIYLESQKNNNFFLILTKSLNSYFSHYSNNFINKGIMMSLYALSFNIWIEDNKDLDKTMAFLGNSLDYVKKIKSLSFK